MPQSLSKFPSNVDSQFLGVHSFDLAFLSFGPCGPGCRRLAENPPRPSGSARGRVHHRSLLLLGSSVTESYLSGLLKDVKEILRMVFWFYPGRGWASFTLLPSKAIVLPSTHYVLHSHGAGGGVRMNSVFGLVHYDAH